MAEDERSADNPRVPRRVPPADRPPSRARPRSRTVTAGDPGTVQPRRRRRRVLKILLLVPLVLLVVGGVAFAVAYSRTTVPPASDVSTAQSTKILYEDGSELARFGTNRKIVPLSEIAASAQAAVIAAEDRGFYSEPGISPKGIARALLTNIRGGSQQGGSTITQQYAKNAFLTSERTYTRKVKEVFIALKMTRQRSKEQILEDYLNTIYFGRGASGIEAASETYFNVQAKNLTVAQSAVLASSIRSPAGYDPATNPERAKERFAYVLDGMIKAGELSESNRSLPYPDVRPPGTASGATDLSGPAGAIVKRVRAELTGVLDDSEFEAGGFTIRTTIDPIDQAAAVAAVQKVTGADKGGEGLQGALVSIEPGSGVVRAYYGGAASGSGIDYADTPRQPGSSFKPYVLATALEQGISLRSTFSGKSPQTFDGGVEIKNFGNSSYGQVDLVRATKNSINTPYYALGQKVGPENVRETAYAMGVARSNPLSGEGATGGSIALGGYEVRPIDQAVGYATFASGGIVATPVFVAEVVRDGKQIYAGKTQNSRAFSEEVAADATYAMQQVVDGGSGAAARLPGREVAGKTGTTSNNFDTWFVGFTPQLATATWIGYGTPTTIKLPGSGQATGGGINAGIWKSYMTVAVEGMDTVRFPPRANVGKTTGVPAIRPSKSPSKSPSKRSSPTPTAKPTPSPTDGSAGPGQPSAPPTDSPKSSATAPPATSRQVGPGRTPGTSARPSVRPSTSPPAKPSARPSASTAP